MPRTGDQRIARAASFQAGMHQWQRNDSRRAEPQRMRAATARFCENTTVRLCVGQIMSLPSGLCLVTGATGFVGAAVARALVKTGQNVRVLARPNSDRRNLQGLKVEIAEGSLEDAASLAAAVAGCRYLFHVAADYRLWVPDPRSDVPRQCRGHPRADAGGAGRRRRADRLYEQRRGARHRQGRHCRRGDAEPRRGHDRPLQAVEIRGRGGGARADRGRATCRR